MARSFSADTDVLAGGTATDTADIWTWCFYAKNPGLAGNPGRVFDWAGNGYSGFESGLEWSFLRNWTTAPGYGLWSVANANLGVTLSDWNFYAITYDGTSDANDPLMYTCALGGTPTSRTVSEGQAPSGAVQNLSGDFNLGNQTGVGFRQLGGALAFLSFYNAVLSAGELLEARRYGYANVASLVYRWPIAGSSPEPDLKDSLPLTVNGTSVVADPAGVPESVQNSISILSGVGW